MDSTVTLSTTRLEPDARVLRRLSSLVYRESAIVLGPEKAPFVYARLSRRIRQLRLDGVEAYVSAVEKDRSGRELTRLINLITTHETSFFRENAHFEFLATKVIPGSRNLKIWSAGCASGEEPYSIAIAVREATRARASFECQILATDISSAILTTARDARYPADRLAQIGRTRRHRFFSAIKEPEGTVYKVNADIRSTVSFAELNLLHAWPMRGPFDMIFCRNVMIYFDRKFQLSLARRFFQLLRPGGYLCIGHAESFGSDRGGLELVRPALYRRAPEA